MKKQSEKSLETYRPLSTEQSKLSKTQALMLERVLKGLKSFTSEQLNQLSQSDKNIIIYNTEQACQAINHLKQQKLNAAVVKICRDIVPELCGESVGMLLIEPVYDKAFLVEISELKIPQKEIIEVLIKENILSKDFYKL